MRPRDMPRLLRNRGSPPAGRLRLFNKENSERSEEFFQESHNDYWSVLWEKQVVVNKKARGVDSI